METIVIFRITVDDELSDEVGEIGPHVVQGAESAANAYIDSTGWEGRAGIRGVALIENGKLTVMVPSHEWIEIVTKLNNGG